MSLVSTAGKSASANKRRRTETVRLFLDSYATFDLTVLGTLMKLMQAREAKPIDSTMLAGMKIPKNTNVSVVLLSLLPGSTQIGSKPSARSVILLPYSEVPGMDTDNPIYLRALQTIEAGHANIAANNKKSRSNNHAEAAVVDSGEFLCFLGQRFIDM